MKRRFRSLLIESVNISTPGLQVLTLAVHRHLPDLAAVEPHRHRSGQALLYLRGEGWQTLSRNKARIEPGTLVVIPPGVSHAFARSGKKVPLCLAIDFRVRHPGRRRTAVSSLNRSEVAHVRQSLAHLTRIQTSSRSELECDGAVLILQIMVTLLRSAGWLSREIPSTGGHSGKAIVSLLGKLEPSTPLSAIISQSGYQRDYLNSLVKRETGLTLGQYRAQQRLSVAKRLLAAQIRVSSVAVTVGLPDQSYFARWFRRQTGQQPSVWGRGWH